MENSLLIIGIIIWCIVGFLIAQLVNIKSQTKDRLQSIKQSKASILWNIKEQIAPLSPWFPYHTKDMVFIGKGFDYLVLDGLAEGNLKHIIFLEIKTWRSLQNKNEKQIQHIIDAKLVKYQMIRMST